LIPRLAADWIILYSLYFFIFSIRVSPTKNFHPSSFDFEKKKEKGNIYL